MQRYYFFPYKQENCKHFFSLFVVDCVARAVQFVFVGAIMVDYFQCFNFLDAVWNENLLELEDVKYF